jgi:hypothetical protein
MAGGSEVTKALKLPKEGDRVRSIKQADWVQRPGEEGIVVHLGEDRGPKTSISVKWDTPLPGHTNTDFWLAIYPWCDYIEVLKSGKPSPAPERTIPKVGDRVRCIQGGRWEPSVGTEGTIDDVNLDFHSGHEPDDPEKFGEVGVAWDHGRMGHWGNYPWEEYIEILKPDQPTPAPKKVPKRPKDFQPGDRVRCIEPEAGEPPKGSIGTVIGMITSKRVAVDWAPWKGGHDMNGTLDQIGFPGKTLPGRTGWNLDTKALVLVQRGNTVYKED